MASREPPVAAGRPVTHLHSCSHSYTVQSILGEGGYGKVFKCIRKDTNKTVVVKVIKDVISKEVAKGEVAILKKLRASVPNAATLVQLNYSFFVQGRLCLEFDLLDISLFDFMEQRYYSPMSLTEMRPIIHQLASGLQHLKALGIIHADMKPGNVMMVDHRLQPHRVKIIDFGIAHDVSATTPGVCIQTLQYRSPEVMLGLSYTEAIDVWSLGCMAVFLLHGGFFLFIGKTEYEMMRSIVKVQGQLPDHLLKSTRKTREFFKTSTGTNQHWKLKTPEEFYGATRLPPEIKLLWRIYSLDDLFKFDHLCHRRTADTLAGKNDQAMFVDLMKGMLHLDAARRLTPCHIMQHPFFCQSSDDVNAASSHQPVRPHPTCQNVSPIHLNLNTDPSNSSRTQSQVRSEMKRNSVEDEVQRLKKRKRLDLDQFGKILYQVREDLKREAVKDEVHSSNWRPANKTRIKLNFDQDECHYQQLSNRAHPAQKAASQWIDPSRKSSPTQPVHRDVTPLKSKRVSESEKKSLFEEDGQRISEAGQLNSTQAAATSAAHSKETAAEPECSIKRRAQGNIRIILLRK